MLIGREAYPKYPAILFILIQIDDKGFFCKAFFFYQAYGISAGSIDYRTFWVIEITRL